MDGWERVGVPMRESPASCTLLASRGSSDATNSLDIWRRWRLVLVLDAIGSAYVHSMRAVEKESP